MSTKGKRYINKKSGRAILLRAAAQLREPFNPEDLTVAAWTASNSFFGLIGYELDHPDLNRVLACIYGPSGFLKQGLMSKVGPKQFQLTELGKSLIKGENN